MEAIHENRLLCYFTFTIAPFIMGSWWGFLPNCILILIIVIRTALEDRTLQKELPGYGEYAQKVKYRLVPFIL
jgi:protein-S-isoprenylcysteine O-methyltransferase Ste14